MGSLGHSILDSVIPLGDIKGYTQEMISVTIMMTISILY